jgi:hypothetical protein
LTQKDASRKIPTSFRQKLGNGMYVMVPHVADENHALARREWQSDSRAGGGRPLWVAICLCALLARAAVARDIYVNNTAGSDALDGSTPVAVAAENGPVRTIARALAIAHGGDRIMLAATSEPYRECVTLQGGQHSGVAPAPLELVGNGAVLDGTRPIPPGIWEHVRGNIFRFSPPRMAYQLLYRDGKPATRHAADAGATELPQLQPLEWCLFDRHVYFRVEDGKVPEDYELSHTALQTGITLYDVHDVVLRDLVIQGFQLDGVNAHDGVTSAQLTGLTSRGNGRAGISIGGASRVRIEACLVGNNGAAQVRTEGFSHTEIVNCDLLDNTAPALVRDGGQVTATGTKGIKP